MRVLRRQCESNAFRQPDRPSHRSTELNQAEKKTMDFMLVARSPMLKTHDDDDEERMK